MTDNVLPPTDPPGNPLDDLVADAVLAACERSPSRRQRLLAILVSGGVTDWVDQSQSQLGRRRHRAAVRAAIEAGDERARIVGRRHLMRRDLYESVLLAHGRRQVAMAVERESASDDLAAELGLEAVG